MSEPLSFSSVGITKENVRSWVLRFRMLRSWIGARSGHGASRLGCWFIQLMLLQVDRAENPAVSIGSRILLSNQ